LSTPNKQEVIATIYLDKNNLLNPIPPYFLTIFKGIFQLAKLTGEVVILFQIQSDIIPPNQIQKQPFSLKNP